MNTECTPTIPLDACIHIIHFAPFTDGHWLPILASDPWQATLFVQGATICAAKGRVDKAVGQFSGFLRHLGYPGSFHQRHHDRRPRERCPASTMFWRMLKICTQLFHLLGCGDATKNRSEVHSIAFARPNTGYRIVIAEPAITPH